MATAETDKPGQLLRSLRESMEQATSTMPDVDSVSRAKEEVLNTFVFGFSSQQNLLRRAVIFDLFGIPDSYIYEYRDKIKKVDAEGVRAAAARHVHPDKWVTVVIGDADRLVPEISRELSTGVTIETLQLDDYAAIS
jgi:zinc protease